MPINLMGRNFLTLLDFNKSEIRYLLNLAHDLKAKKNTGLIGENLKGKNISLLFEKTSTRTRCAFTVAAHDEGANTDFLGKDDIQLGKKESIADTACVLGRMFDGIAFRGFKHDTVLELARNAGIPVWNGLTDSYHPTQILADFMTIEEKFNKLEGINLAYLGDGRNNVAHSMLIASAIMGVNITIISPESLCPSQEILRKCRELLDLNNCEIKVSTDPEKGVRGADVIYTDVWVSMGEEDQFKERINLLKPYQVNQSMLENSGNEDVLFMHCLPAFHNLETKYGQMIFNEYGIQEMEVTDEVFEGPHSIVFDQAENRMHTIKSVMLATLG